VGDLTGPLHHEAGNRTVCLGYTHDGHPHPDTYRRLNRIILILT